ncbi:MAG: hypothetical protein J4431_01990 [Candidatus Aenigmarchaeota archaeon]|nr:hypothetical protein [Candidatus Aenigmarchaeota archaeon]
MVVTYDTIRRVARERRIPKLPVLKEFYVPAGYPDAGKYIGNSFEMARPPHSVEEYRGPDSQNPEELVAVHVTDAFPEGGVIRTSFSHEPTAYWRETIHFALNGPVESHEFGTWERRRYAVLIPLDGLIKSVGTKRILGLKPEDTYVLGDVELPEGSLVVAGNIFNMPRSADAGKAILGIENFSLPTSEEFSVSNPFDSKRTRGISPFRAGVYNTIMGMGYDPMRTNINGWVYYDNDGRQSGPKNQIILPDKLGLPETARWAHSMNWPYYLETRSDALHRFWYDGRDPGIIEKAIEETVPEEHRDFILARFMKIAERYKSSHH